MDPQTYDAQVAKRISRAHLQNRVPAGLGALSFDPETDLIFDYDRPLASHPNAMILMATDAQGDVIDSQTYYSIEAGFVRTEEELQPVKRSTLAEIHSVPHRCTDVGDGQRSGCSIAEMKRHNEVTHWTPHLSRGVAGLGSDVVALIAACTAHRARCPRP